jgi:uncharacterized protein YcfJ
VSTIRMAGILLSGMSLALLGGCNESAAEVAQATATHATAKKVPREVCTDEVVTVQKPVKDKDRILGTVAGAVVGGVVGNEVGGKGTKGDVATVGGAVAGGYAGNRIQKSVQKSATETTTKRVCKTVYE